MQLLLKPISFEIPGFQHDMTLIGRDWLFPELEKMLTKESNVAKNSCRAPHQVSEQVNKRRATHEDEGEQ